MSSPTVLTFDYHDPPPSPWPRILRLIAILTILVGAADVGMAAMTVRSLFNLRKVPRLGITRADDWLWAISAALLVMLGSLLIFGGLRLLRAGSDRLIVLVFWLGIILWPLFTGINAFFQPAEARPQIIVGSLLYGSQTHIFSLLIILLLRAYRKR